MAVLQMKSSVPVNSTDCHIVLHLAVGIFAVLRAVSVLTLLLPRLVWISQLYEKGTDTLSSNYRPVLLTTNNITDGCPGNDGGSFCLINGLCCPNVSSPDLAMYAFLPFTRLLSQSAFSSPILSLVI